MQQTVKSCQVFSQTILQSPVIYDTFRAWLSSGSEHLSVPATRAESLGRQSRSLSAAQSAVPRHGIGRNYSQEDRKQALQPIKSQSLARAILMHPTALRGYPIPSAQHKSPLSPSFEKRIHSKNIINFSYGPAFSFCEQSRKF